MYVGEGRVHAWLDLFGPKPTHLSPSWIEDDVPRLHYGPFVFVNLDRDAEPLADALEGIPALVDDTGVEVGKLRFGERREYVVEANWKFLMENFIEPYHVPVVHHSTTEQPLDDHYPLVIGACIGSAVDIPEDRSTATYRGVVQADRAYAKTGFRCAK